MPTDMRAIAVILGTVRDKAELLLAVPSVKCDLNVFVIRKVNA